MLTSVMLSSLQHVKICTASSWRKDSQAFQSEWERLPEGFSNADHVRSPNSSPPDIFWSSSGSSDVDIILRSRAHHRVVTRLDFDSCVVRSPDTCRHFRPGVTRNVINVESGDRLLHHPEVIVSDHNHGQISRDAVVASNVNPQDEMKQEDSALLICSDRKFSENLVHNFNKTCEKEFSLQKSPDLISETGNASSVIESSPVIGRRKLSPGERYFRDRNSWKKRRRRKVNDCLQPSDLCEEHATSPLIGFHKSGRKGSYQLIKETETELDLKNNVTRTTIDTDLSHKIAENEMSPVTAPQQNKTSQSSVVSPVMKCHRRLRKQKHFIKISHLGKNCLNITSKSDQDTVQVNDIGLREGGATEYVSSPNPIISPSSPILGKSREKRFRRRKYMRTVRSEDYIQNKKDCCSIVSRKGSLLHGHSNEDTPQQRHMHFMFNNIDDPVTAEEERKTQVDNRLKESQNYTNCDASGVDIKDACAMNEDVKISKEPKCSDEKTRFALFLTETEPTIEMYCNVTDNERSINSPSLESGKVLNGNGQCIRKSVNNETEVLFPNVPNNVSCRMESVLSKRRENMCNSGGKDKGSDDVTSTELLIETETSQDISVDTAAGYHHNDLPQDGCRDKLSVISSPTLSPVSHELDLIISSCSTPKSEKTDVLTHHSQDTGNEYCAYLDSGKKKKRLRLNKSGLAARLQKLLARVQSSTRIRQHEANHLNLFHSSNRGVLLFVHSVWTEYSHLLGHCSAYSGKFVSPQSSEDGNSSSSDVTMRIILVLDPAMHIQIKPWSTLRIYPPWQRLTVTRLNVTLVLGVSCVEEVKPMEKNHRSLSSLVKSRQQVTNMLYTCPCSCLQELSGKKCQFRFPHNGLEFLEYLLPRMMPIGALHSKAATYVGLIPNMEGSDSQVARMGSIEVIVNQGCLITEDSYLQLCVLQVFRYKSRGGNKLNKEDATSDNVCWSILGRDATGECCEVVLDPAPSNAVMSQTWTRIMTRQAIGNFYRLTGFILMRRIHKTKNHGLWSLISKCKEQIKGQNLNEKDKMKHSELTSSFVPPCNLKDEQVVSELQSVESAVIPLCRELQSEASSQEMHVKSMMQLEASELQTSVRKDQLFVYVFSPGTESWEMEQYERAQYGQNISVPKPQLSCLAHSLQGTNDGPARHTYLAKLLYATEDCLYVTDSSLSRVVSPGYVIVSVKPSCFIPSQISTNRATVIILQDIQLDKGNLSADKYSWLTPVSSMDTRRETSACLPVITDEFNLISNVEVVLPDFTLTSAAKELVTITGTVVCVDEETAFVWPACGICENDLLVELGPNQYLCQNCDSSSQTSTKMSLEVFISCPQIPDSCKVKVKLQQDSITNMLPTSQDNSQGYELSSVLGHIVGPLCCVVVRAGTVNFVLNEIPKTGLKHL